MILLQERAERTRHPPDPRHWHGCTGLSRMEAALNGTRLALACSARGMQVKRTPLRAQGRRVAPVRLARSSSRFRKPHDASRDARSNNSGNTVAPSNARRPPLNGCFCGPRVNQNRPDLMLRRKDTSLANCEVECVHASGKPCLATRHTVQHLSQPNVTRRPQCPRLATRELPQRVLVLRTLQAQTRRTQRRAREQRKILVEQARCTPRRAQELHRTLRVSWRPSGNKASQFL